MADPGRGSSDEKTRQRARELLVRLVQSPQQTSETYKARIVLGMDLLQEGQKETALRLLRSFPSEAEQYQEVAKALIQEYSRVRKEQEP